MYKAGHDITETDLVAPDFSVAKANLEKMRKESMDYLFGALDSVRSI